MPIRRLALLAVCGATAACTVSPIPSSSPTPASTAALAEAPRVRLVVEQYLHGLRFNDVASLRSAIDPAAQLLWVTRDGTMAQLSLEAWYRGLADRAGREDEGESQIAALDVTGEAAAVKVVETSEREVTVDYLNLVRANGDWRIVHRVNTNLSR